MNGLSLLIEPPQFEPGIAGTDVFHGGEKCGGIGVEADFNFACRRIGLVDLIVQAAAEGVGFRVVIVINRGAPGGGPGQVQGRQFAVLNGAELDGPFGHCGKRDFRHIGYSGSYAAGSGAAGGSDQGIGLDVVLVLHVIILSGLQMCFPSCFGISQKIFPRLVP